MSVVAIRCPKTRELVSIGIETDSVSFNLFPDVMTHTRCPHCGAEHVWRKRDAQLIDAPRDERQQNTAA